MPISTPGALASSAGPLEGTCWRLVEAQHRVSTLKLVNSLAEQAVLEDLLEEAKPPVPPECRGLHYLLATPFRYDAVYPRGSRFRRAGRTPGVYYASEEPYTAVAEIAFYRLLFFAESPATSWPVNAAEFTAFSVAFRAAKAVDLTAAPLSTQRDHWTELTEYTQCQDLADRAREARIEVIRYESVRDPARGANLALLTCVAFAAATPSSTQTWRLRLSPSGIQALCEFPEAALEFRPDTFSADPRFSGLDWARPR